MGVPKVGSEGAEVTLVSRLREREKPRIIGAGKFIGKPLHRGEKKRCRDAGSQQRGDKVRARKRQPEYNKTNAVWKPSSFVPLRLLLQAGRQRDRQRLDDKDKQHVIWTSDVSESGGGSHSNEKRRTYESEGGRESGGMSGGSRERRGNEERRGGRGESRERAGNSASGRERGGRSESMESGGDRRLDAEGGGGHKHRPHVDNPNRHPPQRMRTLQFHSKAVMVRMKVKNSVPTAF